MKLDKNYGFAEGNNIGMKVAKGDYFIFLNNDVEVDPNWLIELVNAAKEKDVGICGSKLIDFYKKNVIQYAGGFLDITGSPFHRGLGEIDNGKYDADSMTDVFYACGCSFLIKREVVEKLDYCFDPSFFIYFEETDLCWRAWYLGYKTRFAPKSIVYHKGAATTSKMGEKMAYMLYRNKIWSFKKNLRSPLRQILLFLVSTRILSALIYRIAQRRWHMGLGVFRHLLDKKEGDVDLSRISLNKQLKLLKFPIFEKYMQHFRRDKSRQTI